MVMMGVVVVVSISQPLNLQISTHICIKSFVHNGPWVHLICDVHVTVFVCNGIIMRILPALKIDF